MDGAVEVRAGGCFEFVAGDVDSGVDDADVQVLGEDEHGFTGVAASEADVVEPAVVAQRDHAGAVDAVVADAVVRVDQRCR